MREERPLLFIDSGAHSLYEKEVHRAGKGSRKRDYSYYDTAEFWAYVDDYAAFLHENGDVIDHYANVDVIFDPERTWAVQEYLEEEHGLSPVPVVHYGADLKWIEKYMGRGHSLIGIGGLGQEVRPDAYRVWADRVFDFLCPRPSREPVVRLHGFAMTSYRLLVRYPWWSVDSASWAKTAAFGGIFVPHRRSGEFTFSVPPYMIKVSRESPDSELAGRHYDTLSGAAKGVVRDWLEEIGIPLGEGDRDEGGRSGVVNDHTVRFSANLLFFDKLCEWLPEWPWPFTGTVREGFR